MNYELGLYWYKKAAKKYSSVALCKLGDFYSEGVVVPQNLYEGFRMYKKTIYRYWNFEAYYKIANCYYNGLGVRKNLKKAAINYRIAAEGNYTEAQFMFGKCFYLEQGKPKDYEQAYIWFNRAAKEKHPEALYYLGLCYELGQGTTKDIALATKLYKEALDSGVSASADRLKALNVDIDIKNEAMEN
ncbi:MAG: sel1 repeat family protein [Roseburia sp.]|nr:sel1 repeat family protein [Anaeroplasma bactoclasticum]MCM1196400.1 sel1 repeat family protein [Roseburia sp.]MCM1556328.1 sel1 repeat family protein [Anaeroplasma bactoclasticum]